MTNDNVKYFVGSKARQLIYDLNRSNWNMEDFLIEVIEKDLSKLTPDFADYYKSVFLRTANMIGVTIPQKVLKIVSQSRSTTQ